MAKDVCADSQPKAHRQAAASKSKKMIAVAWELEGSCCQKVHFEKDWKGGGEGSYMYGVGRGGVCFTEPGCWQFEGVQLGLPTPRVLKVCTNLESTFDSSNQDSSTKIHTNAAIGMCAAILLNHVNVKMNLVQKINSLILYAGHSSKSRLVITGVNNVLLWHVMACVMCVTYHKT